MLDPQRASHKLLGLLLFQLPCSKRRWAQYMAKYQPVLQSAYPHNAAARLLVMKALRCIDRRDIDGADAAIDRLRPVTGDSTDSDKTLWYILRGLKFQRSGHPIQMAASFNSAARFRHRFYLPYRLLGDYYSHQRLLYDQAETHFLTAINCLYELRPMTDAARQQTGLAYTGVCLCRTMMHRYDEAREALRLAAKASPDAPALHYADALLHAALQQSAACHAALAKLEGQTQHEEAKKLTDAMLTGQDPLFSCCPHGTLRASPPSGASSSTTRRRSSPSCAWAAERRPPICSCSR